MADAHGSGPCVRKDVGVQLPPCPPARRAGPFRGPARRLSGKSPRDSRQRPAAPPQGGAAGLLRPWPVMRRKDPPPATSPRWRLRPRGNPAPVRPCHPDWTPVTAPPPASPRSARPTPGSTPSSPPLTVAATPPGATPRRSSSRRWCIWPTAPRPRRRECARPPEAQARVRIDEMLTAAGWVVQDYGRSTRPPAAASRSASSSWRRRGWGCLRRGR
jgi:hypothetical protein